MKLPMTLATTGCATSVTRSQVSWPSSASITRQVISRIASSCCAIAFGVNARWNSALTRSCFGGSIPMNMRWIRSTGTAWSAIRMFDADEYVSQSRLTV